MRPDGRSDFDHFLVRGQFGFDLKALLDELGQRFAAAIFAVREEHARFAASHRTEPAQQITLARVRAETVQRMDPRLDGDRLAKDSNLLRAVHESAAECTVTLE